MKYGKQGRNWMKLSLTFFGRESGVVRDLAQAGALGLPVLAAIRSFEPESESGLPGASFPEASDAYHRLADQIRGPDFHVRGRAIVVTAADSGSDNSQIALNLATLLARGGSKVVLVDGDLRNVTRRKAGDGSTSSGFAGLLVNQLRTAGSAVVHTLEPKLKLLPAGSVTSDPETLLRSPRLPLVLDQLRNLADHVIVEAPSALAWPESLHLAHQADMTLLVVENGRTQRSTAKQAIACLREASQGMVGLVIDKAPAWVTTPRTEPERAAAPATATAASALAVAVPPVQVVRATAAPTPATATPMGMTSPDNLKTEFGELLSDLEEALKLLRSIRPADSAREEAQRRQDAHLAVIDS
ncbi:MAG TPA: CpsD/CapB family tyrosine-protein kinase [Dehalococcoidia bacterium]|nr:CpsD/CapB family tyrosine-protein kinase [Dehalococcoidia bacterium]